MSAQILPFAPRAKAPPRRIETAAAPDIIIFPGVRYERWPDEQPEAASAAPAAPHH